MLAMSVCGVGLVAVVAAPRDFDTLGTHSAGS